MRREIARSNDVVYEAWDPTVIRRVAVKEMVLPPGMTGAAAQDRVQRFYREARAAGGLSHPNIVTVYEVGEDAGRHFIAMEFLEGPTLREVLTGGQALPVDRAVLIASQLADALAYAHEHGIIHRDVKPDNVHLVAPTMPKLTDFGIARIETEHNITLSGQVFGTPSYMSPEQIAGGEIDARTDVFSLGVMLFEMVAGRKPFVGESVVTITYNIVHETPAIPQNVPEWLAGIIRKALQKNPADRYASAADMAEDLRNHRAPRGMGYANPPGQAPGYGNGSAPGQYAPGQGPWAPAGVGSAHGAPGTTYAPGGAPPLVFQPARQPMRLPKINLPKLSDESRFFLGAMGVTLVVCALIVWAVWASSVMFHKQRLAKFADAMEQQRNQAVAQYNAGHYQSAITLFRSVYNTTRDQVDLNNLQNALVGYGIHESGQESLNAFLEAEKLAPNAARPKVYIGLWYDAAGDRVTALRYWDAALPNLAGASPDLRTSLAKIYLQLGDQAHQYGAVAGQSDQTLWSKAEQADPAGPIGAAAQQRLEGPTTPSAPSAPEPPGSPTPVAPAGPYGPSTPNYGAGF